MRKWIIRNDKEVGDEEPPRIISIDRGIDSMFPQGNKIYFYGEITMDSILNLNRQIDELTRQIKNVQFIYNFVSPPPIELHICSDGGDVFASMAVIDKIINNPVPIETYCEGLVASAATLLSVVGMKRYISKHSSMLIHQVSSGLWGNYTEFKDEIQNLDLIMNLINSVYLDKTKISKKELDEILKHDICFSAEKCLEYGLVDEIL